MYVCFSTGPIINYGTQLPGPDESSGHPIYTDRYPPLKKRRIWKPFSTNITLQQNRIPSIEQVGNGIYRQLLPSRLLNEVDMAQFTAAVTVKLHSAVSLTENGCSFFSVVSNSTLSYTTFHCRYEMTYSSNLCGWRWNKEQAQIPLNTYKDSKFVIGNCLSAYIQVLVEGLYSLNLPTFRIGNIQPEKSFSEVNEFK
jgi:hypothetical protein